MLGISVVIHRFKIVPIDDAHSASFVDGLVGMVTDGLADIALGPVFITSGRLRNVSFSHSWFDTGEVLVTQAPKPSSVSRSSRLNMQFTPLARVLAR